MRFTLKSWVTLDLFEKVAGRRGVGEKALKTNKSRTNGKVGPTIHPSYLEKFCAPLYGKHHVQRSLKKILSPHTKYTHARRARTPTHPPIRKKVESRSINGREDIYKSARCSLAVVEWTNFCAWLSEIRREGWRFCRGERSARVRHRQQSPITPSLIAQATLCIYDFPSYNSQSHKTCYGKSIIQVPMPPFTPLIYWNPLSGIRKIDLGRAAALLFANALWQSTSSPQSHCTTPIKETHNSRGRFFHILTQLWRIYCSFSDDPTQVLSMGIFYFFLMYTHSVS